MSLSNSNQKVLAKLRRLRLLAESAGSEGERSAAEAARRRLVERLEQDGVHVAPELVEEVGASAHEAVVTGDLSLREVPADPTEDDSATIIAPLYQEKTASMDVDPRVKGQPTPPFASANSASRFRPETPSMPSPQTAKGIPTPPFAAPIPVGAAPRGDAPTPVIASAPPPIPQFDPTEFNRDKTTVVPTEGGSSPWEESSPVKTKVATAPLDDEPWGAQKASFVGEWDPEGPVGPQTTVMNVDQILAAQAQTDSMLKRVPSSVQDRHSPRLKRAHSSVQGRHASRRRIPKLRTSWHKSKLITRFGGVVGALLLAWVYFAPVAPRESHLMGTTPSGMPHQDDINVFIRQCLIGVTTACQLVGDAIAQQTQGANWSKWEKRAACGKGSMSQCVEIGRSFSLEHRRRITGVTRGLDEKASDDFTELACALGAESCL